MDEAITNPDTMRVQTINDDTVLEVTKDVVTVKTRISQNDLLRKKMYLEEAIANFQNELADVMSKLDMIYEAQTTQGKNTE